MSTNHTENTADHATTLQASVAMLDHARKVADASVQRLADRLESTAQVKPNQIAVFTLEMRSVINDIEEHSLQSIIDITPIRRPIASRAELEHRAIKAVLSGTEWYTGVEIGEKHNIKAKNKHAAVSRWQGDGKVFAIEREGQRYYPAYAFDEFWNPRPTIAQVLRAFDGYTPFRIASWFESISPALGGKRPREVIKTDPDAVVYAARDHIVGPVHG